ncbi:hypothetical protein M2311_001675 [Rhizobium leguminosarum]|nr:hypothetical protein [Rhizobium leguminosarum]
MQHFKVLQRPRRVLKRLAALYSENGLIAEDTVK